MYIKLLGQKEKNDVKWQKIKIKVRKTFFQHKLWIISNI